MSYKEFGVTRLEGKLDNGIRVVLFQKANSPIYIRTIMQCGSCYDPQSKEGLSHFLEHMMANGSSRFPSKDMLAEHIESVGGMYGLATSIEHMFINTEVANIEDFDRALDIITAAVIDPLLDEKKLETERTTILAEYGRAMSTPATVLYEAVRGEVYKGTSFSNRPLGTPLSINGIVYGDIGNHFKRYIHSKNITIIGAGDVALDLLLEKLNKLAFLSSESIAPEITAGVSVDQCKIHFHHESKQTYLFYGFKGAGAYSHDALCLRIFGQIVAGGRTSRLLKRLRYDLGLIYSIHAARIGNLSSSAIGVVTDTKSENIEKVIDEIAVVFSEILENGVTEHELDFAKNKMIKSLKRSMQTSASWVDFHAYGEVVAPNEYWQIDSYISLLEKITLEELNGVIKKYINPENHYIVTVGNK